ncbi:unnamed protein product [Gordionus sp. m RMFG-2023]
MVSFEFNSNDSVTTTKINELFRLLIILLILIVNKNWSNVINTKDEDDSLYQKFLGMNSNLVNALFDTYFAFPRSTRPSREVLKAKYGHFLDTKDVNKVISSFDSGNAGGNSSDHNKQLFENMVPSNLIDAFILMEMGDEGNNSILTTESYINRALPLTTFPESSFVITCINNMVPPYNYSRAYKIKKLMRPNNLQYRMNNETGHSHDLSNPFLSASKDTKIKLKKFADSIKKKIHTYHELNYRGNDDADKKKIRFPLNLNHILKNFPKNHVKYKISPINIIDSTMALKEEKTDNEFQQHINVKTSANYLNLISSGFLDHVIKAHTLTFAVTIPSIVKIEEVNTTTHSHSTPAYLIDVTIKRSIENYINTEPPYSRGDKIYNFNILLKHMSRNKVLLQRLRKLHRIERKLRKNMKKISKIKARRRISTPYSLHNRNNCVKKLRQCKSRLSLRRFVGKKLHLPVSNRILSDSNDSNVTTVLPILMSVSLTDFNSTKVSNFTIPFLTITNNSSIYFTLNDQVIPINSSTNNITQNGSISTNNSVTMPSTSNSTSNLALEAKDSNITKTSVISKHISFRPSLTLNTTITITSFSKLAKSPNHLKILNIPLTTRADTDSKRPGHNLLDENHGLVYDVYVVDTQNNTRYKRTRTFKDQLVWLNGKAEMDDPGIYIVGCTSLYKKRNTRFALEMNFSEPLTISALTMQVILIIFEKLMIN